MKLSIIKTGGKQYLVSEGDKIKIEKLDAKEGEQVTFDQVMLVKNDDDLKIGEPLIEKANVKANVLEQGKREKVTIFKYKAKKRQKKKKGHRQPFTKVEIIEINS